jgi:uncharacterized repeat protein (TIGR03943 family)
VSPSTRLVALGYGAYLVYAWWTGGLYFYIHPVYVGPTVAAGLVLVLLAALASARTPAAAGPGPRAVAVAGLAVPLLVGFLLPAQPLTLSAAAQRGVETTTGAPVEGAGDLALGLRPEDYTIKDWVKAFQADPEPGRHAGKPARVTGFVYRADSLPADWFLVARFVVKCCAVDAQPVGLPVRAPDGRAPETGHWVAVEGVWEVAEVGGGRKGVIAARRVSGVPRPDQPYLY